MKPIKKRNVALAVIFSIITFGIYGIYWFVCLTNDSNKANPDEATASGGLAILFTIISFGFYSYYWHYKLGKKLTDAGVMYLVICLIGFGWINYILAQSELNKIAD